MTKVLRSLLLVLLIGWGGDALAAGEGAPKAIGPNGETVTTQTLFSTAANDPAITWLSAMFGPLIGESGKVATGDGSKLQLAGSTLSPAPLLGEVARMFNTIVLAVAALFFSFILVLGTVQTAHDGEVLGRQWSSLWVPVRLVVAAGGMVPLPSGYCAVQLMTAQVAMLGVGAANWVWINTVDMAFKGAPLVAQAPPTASALVHNAMRQAVCRHAVNYAYGLQQQNEGETATSFDAALAKGPFGEIKLDSDYGKREADAISGKPTGYEDILDDSGGAIAAAGERDREASAATAASKKAYGWVPIVKKKEVVDLAKGAGAVPVYVSSNVPFDTCGYFTYSVAGNGKVGNKLVPEVAKTQVDSFTTLIQSGQALDTLARTIVEATAASPNQANSAEPLDKAVVTSLAKVVQAYDRTLEANAQQILAKLRSNDQSTALRDKMRAGGWTAAGGWYMTLSSLNAEFSLVMTALPAAEGMNLRMLDNETANHYVDPALKRLDTLWNLSFSGSSATNPTGIRSHGTPGLNGAMTNQQLAYRSEDAGDGGKLMEALASRIADVVKSGFRFSSDANILSFWIDPLSAIVAFGHAISAWSWGMLAAMASGGVAIYLLSKVTAVGAVLDLFTSGTVGLVVSFIIMLFISAGAFLSYIVPMMPYITWTSAVIGWLVLVTEAILAGALWAFAHLKADGNGFAGQAGTGYMITLNVFLRPMLMLAGLFSGMAILTISARYILSGFEMAVQDALTGYGEGPVAAVVYTVVLAGMLVAASERSFSLIRVLPDTIVRWLGGQGESWMGDQGEAQRTTNVAGLAVSRLDSAAHQLGRNAGGQGGSGGSGRTPGGGGPSSSTSAMPVGRMRPGGGTGGDAGGGNGAAASWVSQSGGLGGLTDQQRAHAQAAYGRWAAEKPALAGPPRLGRLRPLRARRRG